MEKPHTFKHKEYTLIVEKEEESSDLDYVYYAEVKELEGCYFTGMTIKEIKEKADNVIKAYLNAKKEMRKQKPKVVSVKLKPSFYSMLIEYANDNEIDNLSTFIRSVLAKDMRKHGYNLPSQLAP